ncbi:reverse transcriptase (RNA-dependent DNA polymerase) domain-containing protein [Trichoderma afarasin]
MPIETMVIPIAGQDSDHGDHLDLHASDLIQEILTETMTGGIDNAIRTPAADEKESPVSIHNGTWISESISLPTRDELTTELDIPHKTVPGFRRNLLIAQVNLKCAPERARKLQQHMLQMEQTWDVVAIQDPPPEIIWPASDVRRTHHLWYQSVKFITENDHRILREDGVAAPELQTKVAFLVSREIPETDWRVTVPHWANNMLATLSLTGPFGVIKIHNVYRNTNVDKDTRLDMDKLVEACCTGDEDILLGDFNLHHGLWAGPNLPKEKTCSDARLLASMTERLGMKLVTEPGKITYSRGTDKSMYSSTLDLFFISQSLYPRFVRWKIVDVDGFKSDHCVCQTELDTRPNRRIGLWYSWRATREKDYCKMVKDGLKELPTPDLSTTAGIDAHISDMTQVLVKAVSKTVPASFSCRLPRPAKTPQQGEKEEPQKDEADQTQQKTGKEYQAEKDSNSAPPWMKNPVWHIANQPKRRAKPADLPYTPDFQFAGKTATTGLDKSIMYMDAIYGQGKTSQTSSVYPQLPENLDCAVPPESKLALGEEGNVARQGEVLALINDLPTKKSSGIDVIANEALQMAASVIAPYLEKVFNACIENCYHPTYFKRSRTILFLKLGKAANNPKSYRPIALLSCMGKVLERLIATRIKEFLEDASWRGKELIPMKQFGGLSGRSTTLALKTLVNFVYTGWNSKFYKKVSLLGLDISGAFPRVDRNALLQTLADKGLPGWIVKYVWSFLCNRQTVVELAGHHPEPFFENGGLPQGSVLSPILFLFFAAPLVDNHAAKMLQGPIVEILAFVDDTYILVRSDSWERNCQQLAKVHSLLFSWAQENKIAFAPDKYGMLHFLGPGDKEMPVTYRPPIENLPSADVLFKHPYLDILGLRVDRRLSWVYHVKNVVCKVSKQMRYLNAISGSTWGPVLRNMRLLHYSKIRSIVQYACPAWSFTCNRVMRQGCMTKSLARHLDTLQGTWIVKISGAMKRTPRIVLRKELHIFRLSEYLQMRVISDHAINYDTKHIQEIRAARHRALQRNPSAHPFARLDILAQRLIQLAKDRTRFIKESQGKRKAGGGGRDGKNSDTIEGKVAQSSQGDDEEDIWSDPACAEERRRAIQQTVKDILNHRAYEEWDRYRKKHRKRPVENQTLAIKEPWSLRSLKYYDDLKTRRECTMLLHCRTGYIGLRSYLNRFDKEKPTTCPYCEDGPHTIQHLFMSCEGGEERRNSIAEARRILYSEVGDEDYNLSSIFQQHTVKAVKFALATFGIPQFCKDNWDAGKKQSPGGNGNAAQPEASSTNGRTWPPPNAASSAAKPLEDNHSTGNKPPSSMKKKRRPRARKKRKHRARKSTDNRARAHGDGASSKAPNGRESSTAGTYAEQPSPGVKRASACISDTPSRPRKRQRVAMQVAGATGNGIGHSAST